MNVWSTPETRQNLTDIENLLIDTPSGEYVHLADVADLRIVPTPNDIHHEELSRSIDVGANVDGRDLGSAVGELQDRMEEVQWPLEFRTELLGEFTERQAAEASVRVRDRRGGRRVPPAPGVVRELAARAAVLPDASDRAGRRRAGRVPRRRRAHLGSLVGFFTVLGIVARNGIMLISHYQHLEQFEGEPFGLGLVIRGARERVVPIMMTVLTTGLVLIPLIVAGQIPGNEIEHPMAIVILGGLITATPEPVRRSRPLPALRQGGADVRVACPLPPDAGITDGRGAVSRPVAVAGAILLLASGCDRSRQENTSRPDGASDSASSTVAEPAVSPPSVVTMADYDPRFFDEISHIVDHPWFPLEPGTRFVFRGPRSTASRSTWRLGHGSGTGCLEAALPPRGSRPAA